MSAHECWWQKRPREPCHPVHQDPHGAESNILPSLPAHLPWYVHELHDWLNAFKTAYMQTYKDGKIYVNTIQYPSHSMSKFVQGVPLLWRLPNEAWWNLGFSEFNFPNCKVTMKALRSGTICPMYGLPAMWHHLLRIQTLWRLCRNKEAGELCVPTNDFDKRYLPVLGKTMNHSYTNHQLLIHHSFISWSQFERLLPSPKLNCCGPTLHP